jgi:hypothetical protein
MLRRKTMAKKTYNEKLNNSGDLPKIEDLSGTHRLFPWKTNAINSGRKASLAWLGGQSPQV